MAGHSQFKNIMHRKGAQDKKRAKIFTKIIKEITVAVKEGNSTDPASNPKLRLAIVSAKSANMPKDNVERAIAKASGADGGQNYEEIRYEGYGPGGIALIVEALTDNKNRSASNVRSYFTKSGGSLGESGSVAYLFNRFGVVRIEKKDLSFDDVLEVALEAGAQDCVEEDDYYEITCAVEDYSALVTFLEQKFGNFIYNQIDWVPQSLLEIDEEKQEKLLKLINNLEDDDDVQNVYCNANFTLEY